MLKGIFKDAGFIAKVFQFIGVVFFAIILLSLVTVLATDSDLNNINSVKQMQLIQSLILFVGTPLILAYLWSEKPIEYLQLNTRSKLSSYILVIITMIVAIPAINYLTYINKQIVLPNALASVESWMKITESQLEVLTIRILNVHSIYDLAFNLMLVAILAGLGEELFFRGILQKILGEWKNGIFAIWFAAFIFSTIHMQFYGFFPRLLLGAFFGYLLFWSGNLWLPILAHTINNAIGVIFYYLKFNGVTVPDIDTIGTGNTIYLAAISVILTSVCVRKIKHAFS